MDILYTLGRASHWNDNELRYSLRSIARYGRNVGRVHIVGPYRPDWLSPDVNHIYCADRFDVKAKNIMLAIQTAVHDDAIANDFLLSSDDHFYLRETDFARYPYYYKGELPMTPFTAADGPSWAYHEQLFQTRLALTAAGLTAHNFAQHCNTHFQRDAFMKYESLMERCYSTPQGCEATCLMINAILKEKPFTWTLRHDIKVAGAANRRALDAQIAHDHCFSIADRAINRGVSLFLQERFPEKSKYEI